MTRRRCGWLALATVTTFSPTAVGDPWGPPTGYYDAAVGTGAALEAQLAAIMAADQIQRAYGDFRQSAAITDADPDTPGHLLTVYDRTSVPAAWDAGRTWNREHVWPQSLQPGSASNSTRGHLGDPHALRPAVPGINASRSNKPFAFADTVGGFGPVADGFYFPGDADKGDIARQLFYSDTLYGTALGIGLSTGDPGENQMGDLRALLAWHRDDPPDDFERRRNHTIYSPADNPDYHTLNRNAYIDHPEFAYHVFARAGDATLDFAIDQTDLDAVLSGWGAPGGWTDGDFNRTGGLEQGDLDAVLQNWGNTSAPDFTGTLPAAVPEPVTAALLGLAASARRRRRR